MNSPGGEGSPGDQHSAASPGKKRARKPSPTANAKSPTDETSHSSASAFRNVSACNRCRVRKNRCDQKLPACTSCEKAGTKCVSYDHITKRELPRSYVYYLETRIDYLESLLQEHGILFSSAEDFVHARPIQYHSGNGSATISNANQLTSRGVRPPGLGKPSKREEDSKELDNLVSSASKVAVQGTSDSRFLGAASGISFARVVFAAVKSSLSNNIPNEGARRASQSSDRTIASRKQARSPSGVNMRDSFFGLHTKPSIKPAPFPSRELGLRLVNLYFEHANPQIPILHRPEFMQMFDKVFSSSKKEIPPRESFMLNIVFAIGAGIIVGKPAELEGHAGPDGNNSDSSHEQPPQKRRKLAEEQRQPEEYHASAIVHLESLLNGTEGLEGIGGSLEELQAVLLLAGFALLRPTPPGLWYIIGVAVRLAVDLGLHADDGVDGDTNGVGSSKGATGVSNLDVRDRGRKQYISDFRRRLWWCTYSFDRLVSSVVGRPFGIGDRFITTQFPSRLDDQYITAEGFMPPPRGEENPSYKRISYHYFRLRLLQSEILETLQYRQSQLIRDRRGTSENPYMLTDMPCPFLKAFDGSFRRWRSDVESRLLAWLESAPTPEQTGVKFSPLFLELNYWHAILMLYRQSLSIPADLADDGKTVESVQSPLMIDIEENQDADMIFMKVAAAGQKVLKLYRQLHRKYLVNYTYLSTHHLFMAGISFLYAIWHSPLVRSNLTLDDVDFTALAGTSVLDDLVVFCPPARACRDAFSRMTKATIKMCLATTGFGSQTQLDPTRGLIDPQLQSYSHPTMTTMTTKPRPSQDLTMDPNNPNLPFAPATIEMKGVSFESDLRNLFSEEESLGKTFSSQQTNHPSQFSLPQTHLRSLSNQSLIPIDPLMQLQNADYQAADPPFQTPFPPAPSPGFQQPNLPQQPQQQQQQQYGMSPWSELDFLESVSIPDALDVNFNDANLDPLGLGFTWDGSVPGLDLGNGSVDVFDGFFFGGTGNGTGYGGTDMTGP